MHTNQFKTFCYADVCKHDINLDFRDFMTCFIGSNYRQFYTVKN